MEGNQFSGPWVWGPMRKNEVAIQLEKVPVTDDATDDEEDVPPMA